jgi:hypothetical protein
VVLLSLLILLFDMASFGGIFIYNGIQFHSINETVSGCTFNHIEAQFYSHGINLYQVESEPVIPKSNRSSRRRINRQKRRMFNGTY